MNPMVSSDSLGNLNELVAHFLGESFSIEEPNEVKLQQLSRLFHIHCTMREGKLLMVAHPTKGQRAHVIKFPTTAIKVTRTAQSILDDSAKQPPVMSIGYKPLRNGFPAISVAANYAALVQLREQLNMAIDNHDFDFEPFSYTNPSNGRLSGLRIDFIADKTLPEAPQPQDATTDKEVA